MERGDLLEANGGDLHRRRARRSTRSRPTTSGSRVTGNPANTNALIAMSNAPDIPHRAVLGPDPARPQPRHLAARREDRGAGHRDPEDDDLGQPLGDPVPRPVPRRDRWPATPPRPSATRSGWRTTFIPTVAKRGAAIIEARGSSSAASAASATIDHARDWVERHGRGRLGLDGGRAPTAPTASPEGLISSFPVTTRDGRLGDRPGPRDRRLLARAHRRLRGRAGRGARRRPGSRPHLTLAPPPLLAGGAHPMGRVGSPRRAVPA